MLKVDISAVHFEADAKLQSYITKKIGKLEKYLSHHDRNGASAEVACIEEEGKSKNRFTCEVTIRYPGGEATAKEATINMYAAVDIAEAKVKSQLMRRKERQDGHNQSKRAKFKRILRFSSSEA